MISHPRRGSFAAAATAAAALVGLLTSADPAGAGEGGSWAGHAALNIARQETGAARVGHRVYVVGGLVTGPIVVATNTGEVYDITTDQWSMIPPMPQPRDHPAVTALGGRIYVIGGYNASFFAHPDVFVYDPTTSQWSTGPSLPSGRAASAAVSHGGKVYVFGGTDSVATATTFILDPSTGWSAGAPMPTAREHLTAAVVENSIYVIGGRGPIPFDTNERYVPATDQWTQMASMPTARSAMAIAADGERIFVLGGELPGVHAANEVYNAETDHWTCQKPMPIPRHGLPAVLLDDRILLPGGGKIQGLDPTAVVDAFLPGPTWEVSGPCPGAMSFRASGLRPGGPFVLFMANGPGNAVLHGIGCGGIPLALDANTLSVLPLVLTAGPDGKFGFDVNVPAALCGALLLQLVDAEACQASNVAPL